MTLDSLETKTGVFEFIVDGIINSPNFRESGSFSNIHMVTSEYFDIQLLESHDHLTVTNDVVATITEYEQK